jgi:hypothetical protein
VKEQGIGPGDSAGKHIPIKGMVYLLLDDQHAAPAKFTALQRETLRRYFKLLLVPKLGDEHISPALAQNQQLTRTFLRQIVDDLAANPELVDDIPVHQLNMAEQLVGIAQRDNPEEILGFLLQKHHLPVLVSAMRHVLIESANKAFPPYLHWGKTQRLFYVWYSMATFSITKLKDAFKAFKGPDLFEQHVKQHLDLLKNPLFTFHSTLASWLSAPTLNGEASGSNVLDYTILNVFPDGHTVEVCNIRSNQSYKFSVQDLASVKTHVHNWKECKEAVLAIWKLFAYVMDGWGQFWKGRKSNCYGLSEMDYDVVMALKDPTLQLAEKLNATQLSEYNKAKEFRSEIYAKFVGQKPEIAKLGDTHHTEIKQQARNATGKPRISIVIIGNVDAGTNHIHSHSFC